MKNRQSIFAIVMATVMSLGIVTAFAMCNDTTTPKGNNLKDNKTAGGCLNGNGQKNSDGSCVSSTCSYLIYQYAQPGIPVCNFGPTIEGGGGSTTGNQCTSLSPVSVQTHKANGNCDSYCGCSGATDSGATGPNQNVSPGQLSGC
jgi:hypothetical protein